jgi:hypothetical protein
MAANAKQLCAQLVQAEDNQDYHKLLEIANERKFGILEIFWSKFDNFEVVYGKI